MQTIRRRRDTRSLRKGREISNRLEEVKGAVDREERQAIDRRRKKGAVDREERQAIDRRR
jgi:hypothetical protein